MMTDQRAKERATLHARPSAIEQLAADYPSWQISRVHGDWKATRSGVDLYAATPPELLVRLERHELDRLQAEHGDRYVIRRTPTMWMATRRIDDGTEPTLMRDTSAGLEGAMRAPSGWGNVPYMRERP